MYKEFSPPLDFQDRLITIMKHKDPTKSGFAYVCEKKLPFQSIDDEVIVLKFRPDHCDGEYYLHIIPNYEPMVELITKVHVNNVKTTAGLPNHPTALYEERHTTTYKEAIWDELLAPRIVTGKHEPL